MSFIGNIAAAQTAKAIGNYNKAVYDQQYKFETAKQKAKEAFYEKVEISQKKVKNIFHIKMILKQGKKNEIRRIFKFSNIKLLSLKRVKFGNIALGHLKEGFWRELTKKEKEYFRKVRLK